MNYNLHYNKPAANSYKGWEQESLPIGNSYMGMTIFGLLGTERLQINEKSLWSGGPCTKRPDYKGGNIDGSYKYLLGMRESLVGGESVDLKPLVKQLVGEESGYGNYLNLGNVEIELGHEDATSYSRGLSLDNAIAYVEYKRANGDAILRENYASYPSRCLVGKISSSRLASLNMSISMGIEQPSATSVAEGSIITFCGAIADNGLAYYGRLAVKTDGEVYSSGCKIVIVKASYVEYYLSVATDYRNNYPSYRGAHPKSLVDKLIDEAVASNYDKIKSAHIADYKRLYDKVTFRVTSGEVMPRTTTNVLIKEYKSQPASENSKYLEELLFNYGRYLMIASGRPNSLPSNLQGVWNATNTPPWGSDYHLNVNFQMNYWHVYPCGLEECATSMIEYMNSLRVPGRVTAAAYHNIVSDVENPENGWVCHVQNTPFGWTCPGWDFHWGWSPASSSWMLQNVFDHYSFTGDKAVLEKDIFPLLLENARFWLQNLVYSKGQDRYVSAPTYSPEHGPISVGNTYEQELVWQLFSDVLAGAHALGITNAEIDKIAEVQSKLNPLGIGKWGQIKEWYEEDSWYKSKLFKKFAYKKNKVQPKHRHLSHLLGVFPGSHVNRKTPKLIAAAKVSMLDRGFGGTGWSQAYKINLWARLKDGKNSHIMLQQLINRCIADNLWDLHPPFQIDGNFGMTNGVCEMLAFSDSDYIELLPSLPTEWKNGSIDGLRAKGGYTLGYEWKKGQLASLEITHPTKATAKIYVNSNTMQFFDGVAEGEFVTITVVNK